MNPDLGNYCSHSKASHINFLNGIPASTLAKLNDVCTVRLRELIMKLTYLGLNSGSTIVTGFE